MRKRCLRPKRLDFFSNRAFCVNDKGSLTTFRRVHHDATFALASGIKTYMGNVAHRVGN